MRGRIIAGAVLLGVLGIGCPHDWMKGGTNDRAMRKDMEEELEDLRQASTPCPEGQSRQEECKQNAEGQLTCEWICR
jgi:hypothetical protein